MKDRMVERPEGEERRKEGAIPDFLTAIMVFEI